MTRTERTIRPTIGDTVDITLASLFYGVRTDLWYDEKCKTEGVDKQISPSTTSVQKTFVKTTWSEK